MTEHDPQNFELPDTNQREELPFPTQNGPPAPFARGSMPAPQPVMSGVKTLQVDAPQMVQQQPARPMNGHAQQGYLPEDFGDYDVLLSRLGQLRAVDLREIFDVLELIVDALRTNTARKVERGQPTVSAKDTMRAVHSVLGAMLNGETDAASMFKALLSQ